MSKFFTEKIAPQIHGPVAIWRVLRLQPWQITLKAFANSSPGLRFATLGLPPPFFEKTQL
jgi:hypothetical protein